MLRQDVAKRPPNAIYHLNALFNADTHPSKLNLGTLGGRSGDRTIIAVRFSPSMVPACLTGIGVYRDESLKPYVFEVVRKVSNFDGPWRLPGAAIVLRKI